MIKRLLAALLLGAALVGCDTPQEPPPGDVPLFGDDGGGDGERAPRPPADPIRA